MESSKPSNIKADHLNVLSMQSISNSISKCVTSFIAISFVGFFLILTFVLIKDSTVRDSQLTVLKPFTLNESLYDKLHDRFNGRQSQRLISRKMIIHRPIQEVFDAVSTPQLWRVCYPETVAVGGVTKRPIKKGDMVLEKFLFGGIYYTMFRYEVEIVESPVALRFHGIQAMSNMLAESVLGNVLRKVGGTFDYKFTKIDEHTTEWQRDLYLYTTADDWFGTLMFKMFYTFIIGSQEKGATLFVNCAKTILESEDYQRELFA
jgi:hypothetical protein